MEMATKVILGLACLLLGAMGLGMMFNPAAMIDKFGVEPSGVVGLSTMRGDIGGLLVSAVAMIGLGYKRSEPTWFLAVALVMSVVAFGRLVGFVLDGPSADTLPPFVIELVLAGLCVAKAKRMGATVS